MAARIRGRTLRERLGGRKDLDLAAAGDARGSVEFEPAVFELGGGEAECQQGAEGVRVGGPFVHACAWGGADVGEGGPAAEAVMDADGEGLGLGGGGVGVGEGVFKLVDGELLRGYSEVGSGGGGCREEEREETGEHRGCGFLGGCDAGL